MLTFFEDELERKGVIRDRKALGDKIGDTSIITAQMCKELYKNEQDYFWAIHNGLYTKPYEFNERFSLYYIGRLIKCCLKKKHFRVLTYNFDEYLEKYLSDSGIDYNILFDDTGMVGNKLPIYHVHGFLPRVSAKSSIQKRHKDSIYLTEEDYNQLYNNPYSWQIASQLSFFRENTCVFVGCGLKDPNIRRLLEITQKDNRIHYAILTKGAMEVSDMTVASQHFARLGVEVIWADSHEDIPIMLKGFLEKLTMSDGLECTQDEPIEALI